MANRSIFVTGAHGFIGRHVSRHLALNGWKVIGIGRGVWSSSVEQEEWGISSWINSDLTVEVLSAVNETPYAIVNCAGSGSVGLSYENPVKDFECNVLATLNILEYARKYAPFAKIIIFSSAAVYGNVGHYPISENESLVPVSPYGVHKKIAEDISRSYSVNFGLNISVLRLFSVYGAGLKKQLLWDASNKIRLGQFDFYGSGNELRDWIHVNDIARLIEYLLIQDKVGYAIYNGASGLGTTVRDVLNLLFKALNVSKKPVFSGIVKLGDPLGYIADIARVENLGWKPEISLEAGIADYVNWLKEND